MTGSKFYLRSRRKRDWEVSLVHSNDGHSCCTGKAHLGRGHAEQKESVEEPVPATTAGKGEPHCGNQAPGRRCHVVSRTTVRASVNAYESSEGPSERGGRALGPAGRCMRSRFPLECLKAWNGDCTHGPVMHAFPPLLSFSTPSCPPTYMDVHTDMHTCAHTKKKGGPFFC